MPPDRAAPLDREGRLEEAVLAYLKAVDAGQPPDPREFLARYPGLTAELTAFLRDEERLRPLVAPWASLVPGLLGGAEVRPGGRDGGDAPRGEPGANGRYPEGHGPRLRAEWREGEGPPTPDA